MRYTEIYEAKSPTPIAAGYFWFHRTTEDRLPSILSNGLKINSENNLTLDGQWSFDAYGCRPIFLSKSVNSNYQADAPVLLAINVEGLGLVADLPSMVDEGAYYSIEDFSMWFDRGPEYDIETLLTPDSPACKKMIRKTKTAACITDIPADRIVKVLQK